MPYNGHQNCLDKYLILVNYYVSSKQSFYIFHLSAYHHIVYSLRTIISSGTISMENNLHQVWILHIKSRVKNILSSVFFKTIVSWIYFLKLKKSYWKVNKNFYRQSFLGTEFFVDLKFLIYIIRLFIFIPIFCYWNLNISLV